MFLLLFPLNLFYFTTFALKKLVSFILKFHYKITFSLKTLSFSINFCDFCIFLFKGGFMNCFLMESTKSNTRLMTFL
ncbi:hypothetical protein FZB88_00495 [Enterococcus faecium]|nr:hypothetical protein F6X80_04680 [Enterococcus faecium]KAA9211002.1 hypothetical protein F6X83_04210 [Enterococcus faecium]KAB1941175.1 hypothetical protein F8181_03530 [Enterococcus faecium]KAB7526068.1 hypothetical protein F8A91_03605 [Enterococcus faecium]KAB7552389.1 hypothetical protein GBM51_13400 [Enterococcus faecium]